MIKCFSCGELGHYKLKCPKLKSKKGENKQLEKEDTMLMMVGAELKPHDNIWIMDSAASTHIVNSKVGLYDVWPIREPIKIGDGKLVYATKVGQLKVSYKACKGENWEFVLENIQYIPDVWINLFSLMTAILKGCAISNEGQMIAIVKNGLKLRFNKEIKTKNSFVCRVRLAIQPTNECLLAMVTTVNHCRTVDINKLHRHASKALV